MLLESFSGTDHHVDRVRQCVCLALIVTDIIGPF